MGKRVLCWCLAVVLFVGDMPFPDAAYAPDEEAKSRLENVEITCKNVPESGEFHDAVAQMSVEKLTDWADGSDFLPDNTVTRDEFYTIAYRKFRGLLEKSKTSSKSDPNKSERDRAIELFRKKGWFGPNEAYGNGEKRIERGEVMGFLFWVYKVIYRDTNKVNFENVYEVKGFSDVNAKDSFAQAVMWATSELKTVKPGYYDGKVQLASGYSNQKFRPTGRIGRITRKQLALFLFRFSSLSFAK